MQRVREAPFRLLCNTFGHCVFVGGEGSTLPNLSMKNEQPQTAPNHYKGRGKKNCEKAVMLTAWVDMAVL